MRGRSCRDNFYLDIGRYVRWLIAELDDPIFVDPLINSLLRVRDGVSSRQYETDSNQHFGAFGHDPIFFADQLRPARLLFRYMKTVVATAASRQFWDVRKRPCRPPPGYLAELVFFLRDTVVFFLRATVFFLRIAVFFLRVTVFFLRAAVFFFCA